MKQDTEDLIPGTVQKIDRGPTRKIAGEQQIDRGQRKERGTIRDTYDNLDPLDHLDPLALLSQTPHPNITRPLKMIDHHKITKEIDPIELDKKMKK